MQKNRKIFLPGVVFAFIISITYGCGNAEFSENPLKGTWKSLWAGSQNNNLDFEVSFESSNSFHINVSGGGQIQPLRISGIYRINVDTFTVVDKTSEPLQICNYVDTGKYTFLRRNDTLLFKVIKDPCEKRKLTLEMGLVNASRVHP